MGFFRSRRAYSTVSRFFPRQSNRPMLGSVVRVPHLGIHRREIKVHLAGELRLEGLHLEIDHHETPQLQVVEEQIKVVVFAFDGEMRLPADESEAGAERDEELLDMVGEPCSSSRSRAAASSVRKSKT
jgi:hypothetical protein